VLTVVVQLQEFRTGQTRQQMETTKTKEDCKDLRNNVTDLRDKINDLDKRVYSSFCQLLLSSFSALPSIFESSFASWQIQYTRSAFNQEHFVIFMLNPRLGAFCCRDLDPIMSGDSDVRTRQHFRKMKFLGRGLRRIQNTIWRLPKLIGSTNT